MKIRTKILLSIIVLAVFIPQNIFAGEKFDPVGLWAFNVPDAPYEYNSGKIEVKEIDDKYVVSIGFEGIEYNFEGEMVFFDKDKFSFSFYVEGEDVMMEFVFSEKDVMSGKAVYSGGILPASAKRVIEDEEK